VIGVPLGEQLLDVLGTTVCCPNSCVVDGASDPVSPAWYWLVGELGPKAFGPDKPQSVRLAAD
jgi:hypothetical protein